MSKILKNTTISNISIIDTGVTILASPGTYTIPPQDYLLWAASSNVVSYIGSGDLVVNDGSDDLSASDGMDLIKGLFPKQIKIIGNTDNTKIGNIGDSLKTTATITGPVIAILQASTIQKNVEFNITAKVETDITGSTYTVTSGKTFYMTSFSASSDSPSPVSFRLKVYNGASLINTIKINVTGNGATNGFSWDNGIIFATAGYTIKATVESQAAKNTGWIMFSGFEI